MKWLGTPFCHIMFDKNFFCISVLQALPMIGNLIEKNKNMQLFIRLLGSFVYSTR